MLLLIKLLLLPSLPCEKDPISQQCDKNSILSNNNNNNNNKLQ